MLELRPTCEHCNKPLPPESLEAERSVAPQDGVQLRLERDLE